MSQGKSFFRHTKANKKRLYQQFLSNLFNVHISVAVKHYHKNLKLGNKSTRRHLNKYKKLGERR